MNITTRSGFRIAKEANKIFSISDDSALVLFNRLWIYPASAVDHTTGKLTANTGTIYIGERTDSGDVTPDSLPLGDGTVDGITPLLIELPQGKVKLLKDIIFQAANANDGVWFKYWPT